MATATGAQCELWVRVYGPLTMTPSNSSPHLQQTPQIISLRQAPPHLLASRREKWITGENFQKDHFLFQPELEQTCLNKTDCTKQHLKYGTVSTSWIWNGPSPDPIYCSAHSLPGKFFCLLANGMDGIRQMLHKAFISPRRLRARRINLLPLGPLPRASGETANWAQQRK